MKKDDFKNFIKNNPKLISYVKNNEMTWQKFYEIYDLYGEDENVWKEYLGVNNTDNIVKSGISGFSLVEFINWLKKVDLDGLQEGIGNVQRVLDVVSDLSKHDSNTNKNSSYRPRPLYKHFED